MEETFRVKILWAIAYFTIAGMAVYAYTITQHAFEVVAIMFMTATAVGMSYANRLDNEANPTPVRLSAPKRSRWRK